MILATAILLAHSWYAPECCGGKDCHPVPCAEISETADGYKWQTYFFPWTMAKQSEDEECHVCVDFGNPQCIYLGRERISQR